MVVKHMPSLATALQVYTYMKKEKIFYETGTIILHHLFWL